MRKERQRLYCCSKCGRVFDDGEDFWYEDVHTQYCLTCAN